MKPIRLRLIGESSLLMNCDRAANPLDPIKKEMSEFTSKTKKTESDLLQIAHLSWLASMYFDENMGPYIPSTNIRASFVEGAKINKLGATIKRATMILEEKIKLQYPGTRKQDEMWNQQSKFVDCRSVVVQRQRNMRYRPKFDIWSCEFELLFDDEQINKSQLLLICENGGRLIGVGDYRPAKGGTFGRYTVQEVK